MFAHTADRQEWVYLVLAGIFLGTLSTVNILGFSRLVGFSFPLGNDILSIQLPLGVLPYPITFLCLDLITELYGKVRANMLIWAGLLVNFWLLFIVWIAGILPPTVTLPVLPTHPEYSFFTIRALTMNAIFGSTLAYLIAQYIDVHLFDWLKTATRGQHLWLRNSASTLISQSIDTFIVLSVATYLTPLHSPLVDPASPPLSHLIVFSYGFKVITTIINIIPFCLVVLTLKRYCTPATLPAF